MEEDDTNETTIDDEYDDGPPLRLISVAVGMVRIGWY
jgi:hypothetical protein